MNLQEALILFKMTRIKLVAFFNAQFHLDADRSLDLSDIRIENDTIHWENTKLRWRTISIPLQFFENDDIAGMLEFYKEQEQAKIAAATKQAEGYAKFREEVAKKLEHITDRAEIRIAINMLEDKLSSKKS